MKSSFVHHISRASKRAGYRVGAKDASLARPDASGRGFSRHVEAQDGCAVIHVSIGLVCDPCLAMLLMVMGMRRTFRIRGAGSGLRGGCPALWPPYPRVPYPRDDRQLFCVGPVGLVLNHGGREGSLVTDLAEAKMQAKP